MTTLNPNTVLEMRRTIRASREKAFEAWTDPGQLRQWFAVAEVDLRVGGRYRLGMKAPGDNPLLVVGGVYREILPPERLVFTWQWESADPNEPETLVTVEFYEEIGGTQIVLTHERFTTIPQRDKHGEGWAGCLDHLQRLLERN